MKILFPVAILCTIRDCLGTTLKRLRI